MCKKCCGSGSGPFNRFGGPGSIVAIVVLLIILGVVFSQGFHHGAVYGDND